MYKGEYFNSISHLVGAALALIGSTILLVIASLQGNVTKIVAFGVYGASLVLLYTISTLYHSVRGKAKIVFHKLDHLAIYLLIAGTYTPMSLIVLKGRTGWAIFGAVWILAAVGILQELLVRRKIRVFSIALYLAMGWLILLAFRPFVAAIPFSGLLWIVAGGFFYTVGIAFYASSRSWRHGHAVWHLFVIFGSVSHYIALLGWVALAK